MGKIVLAVLPSMALEWLAQVLARYHHAYPGFCQGTSIRQHTDQLMEPYGFKYVLEVRQLTTMMGLVAANYVTGLTLF